MNSNDSLENRLHYAANELRRRRSISPLSRSPELDLLAFRHARSMAMGGFFNHFDLSARSPVDRALDSGLLFDLLGDNLARVEMPLDPVTAALIGWMNSPSHRQNLLDDRFTHAGSGIFQHGDVTLLGQVYSSSKNNLFRSYNLAPGAAWIVCRRNLKKNE